MKEEGETLTDMGVLSSGKRIMQDKKNGLVFCCLSFKIDVYMWPCSIDSTNAFSLNITFVLTVSIYTYSLCYFM